MTGTSPYPTHPSPSYQSSSYIPKMEANFMRDFMCCDRVWPTMHDLLQHYEESHTQPVPATKNYSAQMAGLSGSQRPGVGRFSVLTSAVGQPSAHRDTQSSTQLAQPSRQPPTVSGSGMGSMQQMLRQQQQQQQQQQSSVSQAPKHSAMSQLHDELDAVGDMEMDETVGPMDMDDNQRTIQQTRQVFGQQRPQLHLNSSGLAHQGLRTSTPTTPAASNFGFANNPTVSSVNTPTLTTHQAFPQRSSAAAAAQYVQSQSSSAVDDADDDVPGMPMKMSLGNMNLNGGDQFGMGFANNLGGIDLSCIDDPAKRLYSPNGTQTSHQQRALDQQLAQFSLDAGQFPTGAEAQALIKQMSHALMVPEEFKPFKCPVVGCEKAYKNQNGLKCVASRARYSLSLTAANTHPLQVPQDPRPLHPAAARERRRHLLHCQPRDVHPLPGHPGHGEGETASVRYVWQALQEPEWPQICTLSPPFPPPYHPGPWF